VTVRVGDGAPGSVQAAVFDCDGLLVDSAACWRLAYERVLAREDRTLDRALLGSLNGASVRSAAMALRVDAPALQAELRLAFERAPLAACAGAQALLARLRGRLALAVATNAPCELVGIALQRVGLSAYLPVVVGAEALPEKPAPDVYLAACEALAVEPARAFALEDSPVGATAALAAGLRLIYIPSGERGAVPADVRARRLDDEVVFAALGVRCAGGGPGAPAG
jgi:HAD superfamily hydrolase (TIGR01509 family)